MTKSNLNISKRNFLIGLSSISIGSGTILSSSQKVDASITVQGGIDNVTANTSTGEVSDIYFPTDKLSFDISWNNMTNLDDSVTLNIYSKLDSDGDYDMIDTSEFLFPNEKNGSVIFENISWVDNNKLQTPLVSLIHILHYLQMILLYQQMVQRRYLICIYYLNLTILLLIMR